MKSHRKMRFACAFCKFDVDAVRKRLSNLRYCNKRESLKLDWPESVSSMHSESLPLAYLDVNNDLFGNLKLLPWDLKWPLLGPKWPPWNPFSHVQAPCCLPDAPCHLLKAHCYFPKASLRPFVISLGPNITSSTWPPLSIRGAPWSPEECPCGLVRHVTSLRPFRTSPHPPGGSKWTQIP